MSCIVSFTLLAALLPLQVPNPKDSLEQSLQRLPKLDSSSAPDCNATIVLRMALGEAVDLEFNAEYFNGEHRLLVYDSFDRTPLVLVRGQQAIQYAVLNQAILFDDSVAYAMTVKKDRGAEADAGDQIECSVDISSHTQRPSSILVDFRSLFDDRARQLQHVDQKKYLLSEVGRAGSTVQAKLDFNERVPFQEVDIRNPEKSIHLSLRGIATQYASERLRISKPEILFKESAVRFGIKRANESGVPFEKRQIVKTCLARAAARLFKDERASIVESGILTERQIDLVQRNDRELSGRMKALLETATDDQGRGERKPGRS